MGPELTPELRALHKRYLAGIRAVKRGADPKLTLYYVLNPTAEIEQASEGSIPPSWRLPSEAEWAA